MTGAALFDLQASFSLDAAELAIDARQHWFPLDPDEQGRAFVASCPERRHGWVKSACHSFLRSFASDFDINGVLNMYPLYLLSSQQWTKLLPTAGGSLLDVGAGNGDLTAQLAPLYAEVHVTEASRAMRRRLRQRAFQVIQLPQSGTYDAVSCLNVLDRTSHPLSLSRALGQLVAPGGLLVFSVPLPLAPFYFDGPRAAEPVEGLGVSQRNWGGAASELVSCLAETLKEFSLVRLTKAPYLSGGDRRRPLYSLDAAVVVLQRPL